MRAVITITLSVFLSGCIATGINNRGRELTSNESIPSLHEVPDKHEITPLPRKEMAAKEKELRIKYNEDAVKLP